MHGSLFGHLVGAPFAGHGQHAFLEA
jgi:hypothetical protein